MRSHSIAQAGCTLTMHPRLALSSWQSWVSLPSSRVLKVTTPRYKICPNFCPHHQNISLAVLQVWYRATGSTRASFQVFRGTELSSSCESNWSQRRQPWLLIYLQQPRSLTITLTSVAGNTRLPLACTDCPQDFLSYYLTLRQIRHQTLLGELGQGLSTVKHDQTLWNVTMNIS